jgi:hypothetical protein
VKKKSKTVLNFRVDREGRRAIASIRAVLRTDKTLPAELRFPPTTTGAILFAVTLAAKESRTLLASYKGVA